MASGKGNDFGALDPFVPCILYVQLKASGVPVSSTVCVKCDTGSLITASIIQPVNLETILEELASVIVGFERG